jgi:carboxyl-terminal processing protease
MPSPRRRAFAPLMLVAALLLMGLGIARVVWTDDGLSHELERFSRVLSLVQSSYVDAPDAQKLIRGAIDGMISTLDPHTQYLPEKQGDRTEKTPPGDYAGLGITFEIRDDAIVVLSAIEGTPAYRLGVTAGDRILGFDGRPLPAKLSTDAVLDLLRGPVGSVVDVAIERAGHSEPIHLSVERARIPIENVPYAFMIQPDVGYVRITRFGQTTGDELQQAIAGLQGQGMKKLVVDLRSNSGGLLSQAIDVLDLVVPDKKRLVYTRGRIAASNADYYSTPRPGKWAEGPLVVLIDHGSAAASEIVAGAVQDLDRGIVAGTNSFGNGTVQNQMRMDDGARLLLTVARFYTPSGRAIQREYSTKEGREGSTAAALQADVPGDSVLATLPEFKTAGGRRVYGGGGIYPDVLVKNPGELTPSQREMIQKRAFWEFATRYLGDHKDTKWTLESLGPSFQLTDSDWTALRRAMHDRQVAMTDSLFQADRPFMLHQVRMELATQALGRTERYRIATETDTQLHAALELFPMASKLPGQ